MRKVILVTGASSGLGEAIANQLSKSQIVYGTSRKQSHSDHFQFLQMDLTNSDSIARCISTIIEKEGRLDVLINNAGVGIPAPVEHLNVDKVKLAFQTNVFGLIEMTQRALPLLRASKGMVINISSIGSMFGLPYRAAYCATKSAVNMVTETLRMELKQFGVHATSILAGDIQTKISDGWLRSDVPDYSPYHANYSRVIEGIENDNQGGVTPEYIAIRIEKIMNSKRIKRYYAIGKPLQKLSLVIKKILPDFVFEKIIRGYSGL